MKITSRPSMAPREYHPNVLPSIVESLMFCSHESLEKIIAERKAAGTYKPVTVLSRGLPWAMAEYLKENVKALQYEQRGFSKQIQRELIDTFGCSEASAWKAIGRDRKRRGLD